MSDHLLDANHPEAERPSHVEAKKVYRPPVLTKLGSLRDLTMSLNGGGANDGSKAPRGTKRGGNFETTEYGR